MNPTFAEKLKQPTNTASAKENEHNFDSMAPLETLADSNDTEESSASFLDTSKDRRYGFCIGGLNFLVPKGTYCELLLDIRTATLPNSPKIVAGLSNLRGNIVMVYNIHSLLNLPHPKNKFSLLIGQPKNGAILIIDAKPSLIDVTELRNENPLIPEDNFLFESIKSSYAVGSVSWLTLEPGKLFKTLTQMQVTQNIKQ
ncbi:MAG: hypothetical protein ACI9Y1_001556 [Lentisphaeria bacterium]|jgi:hypothetical protein